MDKQVCARISKKWRKNRKRNEFTLISDINGWMDFKIIFRHKKTSSFTNQRRSCFNRTSWQPDYRSFRLRLAALRPNLSECLLFSSIFNYLLHYVNDRCCSMQSYDLLCTLYIPL